MSENGNKKQRTTSSKRADLTFPVARVHRMLRKGRYADHIRTKAAVFLTATLEYLCADLLECAAEAAEAAVQNRKTRINPQFLKLAIAKDPEFSQLLAHVTIAQGGVLPNINPMLLPKQKQ